MGNGATGIPQIFWNLEMRGRIALPQLMPV